MPEIKQIERLIRILQRLSLYNEVKVSELYEFFDRKVPKRTLQRDLVELSCANIPLVTKPGTGKELIWCIDSSYLRFIPETIGSQELVASYFLQRLAVVTHGTSLEKDINTLIDKSKQLISREVFQSLEDLEPLQNLFGSTFSGYIDYTHHSTTIEQLIKAATKSIQCHFSYNTFSKKDLSQFEADPYMLVYHKGALYCVAYIPSHDNYLFLAIQRIQKVELLKTHYKKNKDFDLDKLRKGRFGIYGGDNSPPQKVSLKFKKEMAEVIAERIWHPSQKIKKHRDGSLTLELKVIISDELRSWVAGWLHYVDVKSPRDLLHRNDKQGLKNAKI